MHVRHGCRRCIRCTRLSFPSTPAWPSRGPAAARPLPIGTGEEHTGPCAY
ncbi:hypothetical protein [Ornithinimicrobium kibberense]